MCIRDRLSTTQAANKGEASPSNMATEVLKAQTVAVCEDGMPPEESNVFTVRFSRQTISVRINLMSCAKNHASNAIMSGKLEPSAEREYIEVEGIRRSHIRFCKIN